MVCAALMQGDQSIILRKGGIAEGRDGFRFKHEEFFLFPTQYHQQMEKVHEDKAHVLGVPAPPPEGTVEIHGFYRMEWALWIDDWDVLARLSDFHIYREDVLRERFEYGDERGLQCAFGRVYRLEPSWSFPDKPGYGGCRSWVQLPVPPDSIEMEAVTGEEQHRRVSTALIRTLGPMAANLPGENTK